jgi:hypothetical protein
MSSNTPSDSRGTLKAILITSVLTLIGVCVTTYVVQDFRDKSHREEFLREKRLQSFGDMMGIRVALSQSAVSLQETKINQVYHQAKFSLTHDKLNLDEAMRYVQRSEMLLPEITRDRKRLYELAGSVAVLFPDIPLDIFANLSHIGILEPAPSPKGIAKVSELEVWRVKQIDLAREHIDKQFRHSMGRLVNHMAKNMGVTTEDPISVAIND